MFVLWQNAEKHFKDTLILIKIWFKLSMQTEKIENNMTNAKLKAEGDVY